MTNELPAFVDLVVSCSFKLEGLVAVWKQQNLIMNKPFFVMLFAKSCMVLQM